MYRQNSIAKQAAKKQQKLKYIVPGIEEMALDAAQNSLKDHGDAHTILDLEWLTIVFIYLVNFYVPLSPTR